MKLKIVVLDQKTMDDLDWSELEALGDCTFYERTPADQIYERTKNANIVITNKVPLSKELIEKLPQLKYIGITATGYNNVDTKAAHERNIAVTNVPAYSVESLAQHTIALLLECSNHVGLHNTEVHAGTWTRSPDFSFWKKPLIALNGLTLGIVGFGDIGKAVAKVAQAFGMKVIVTTRTPSKTPGIEFVDRETLFKTSDVISLHCPYSKETHHMVNEKTLRLMKPMTILINTARGKLIDENALAKALKEKRIFAAGLDVLQTEPPSADCPLFHLDNCIITPHIAWATTQARQRLLAIAIDNLKSYLAGTPKNLV